MRRIVPALVIVAIAMAGLVGRGPDGAASGTDVPAPGNAGRWTPVVERLGSADFATRQAAQKELEKATWTDRQTLQRLAAGTGDPEVRARIEDEIADLDEWRALHPEEISIDLDHASFAVMMAALGKATGVTFKTDGPVAGGSFTLHAARRPLWEVLAALNQQGVVLPQDSNFGLAAVGEPMRGGVAEGAFFCWPQKNYAISAPGKAPLPAGEEHLVGLPFTVAMDPRLKLLSFDGPVLTSAVDAAGREMLVDAPAGLSGKFHECSSGQWSFSDNGVARAMGVKRVALMKGEFAVRVVARWATATIADIEKQKGQPVEVAGRTFMFRSVSTGTGIVNVETAISPANGGALPMSFAVHDGTGKLLWESGFKPAGPFFMQGGVGPFRAEITNPLKVVTLHFAFELKDVPLP